MKTAEILSLLQGVRPCGQDRWRAKCPSHNNKCPSLAVMQAHDGRTLICCHAGCATAAICAALGITFADLFDGSRYRLDPIALRAADCEAEIRHALACWREEALRASATDLCERDELIRIAQVSFGGGTIDEETLFHAVGVAYNGYSFLEFRLWQLFRDDLFSDLELWREWREARRKAA